MADYDIIIRKRIASNRTLPKGALHVTAVMRTTAGINTPLKWGRRSGYAIPLLPWVPESADCE